jgi:hypothetical protein
LRCEQSRPHLFEFPQKRFFLGGSGVKTDQGVPRQRVGLHALDALDPAQSVFEPLEIASRPARQVEAHSPWDQAQDTKPFREGPHDHPPSMTLLDQGMLLGELEATLFCPD